jgi:hypothetical protein
MNVNSRDSFGGRMLWTAAIEVVSAILSVAAGCVNVALNLPTHNESNSIDRSHTSGSGSAAA